MDMQPKLIFIEELPFKNKEFEVYFDIDKGFSQKFITSNEYSKVSVILQSPLDIEATVKISSYEDKIIEIPSNSNPVVIMEGNKDNSMVAGRYHFELKYFNKKYVSFYSVKSNVLSDESVYYLRNFVDNMLSGLSKEFFYRRKEDTVLESNLPLTPMQKYIDLSLQKKAIFFTLQSIFNDPISDLVSIYKISNRSKKPDYKSFMWESKKGINNINNSYSLNLFNEKHKRISYVNPENRMLKKIIYKFISDLKNLRYAINKEIKNYDQEIKKIEVEYIHINQKKEEVRKRIFGFENEKNDLNHQQKVISARKIERINQKTAYEKHINEIDNLLYRFNQYYYIDWFKEVPLKNNLKISQRFSKDIRYKKIHDIYKTINSRDDLNKKIISDNRENRKTWQLFEYYNIGIVIKILIDLGFEWTSGWLADENNNNKYLSSLPPGTVLRFRKPNDPSFYLDVQYDAEFESFSTFNSKKSSYYIENNRRPDILLSLFNSNGELLTNKSGLIIESKCRNKNYLFDDKFQTDVKKQLLDFKNMSYFNSRLLNEGEDSVWKPIFQVIVLYPKQDSEAILRHDNIYGRGIVYIQVQPTEINDEENTIGYKSLKNMIELFIKQALERS